MFPPHRASSAQRSSDNSCLRPRLQTSVCLSSERASSFWLVSELSSFVQSVPNRPLFVYVDSRHRRLFVFILFWPLWISFVLVDASPQTTRQILRCIERELCRQRSSENTSGVVRILFEDRMDTLDGTMNTLLLHCWLVTGRSSGL